MPRVPKPPQNTKQRGQTEQAAKGYAHSAAGALDRGIRDDPRFANSLITGSSAGGALTGSLPNPGIGVNQVGSIQLAPGSVGQVQREARSLVDVDFPFAPGVGTVLPVGVRLTSQNLGLGIVDSTHISGLFGGKVTGSDSMPGAVVRIGSMPGGRLLAGTVTPTQLDMQRLIAWLDNVYRRL